MAANRVYPTAAEPDWGIILADGMTSSVAGDETTLTLSGNNMFIFGNEFDDDEDDLDEIIIRRNSKSRVVKQGKRRIVISLNQWTIPTNFTSEYNAIKKQINTWRKRGASPIYLALRKKESGSWRYIVFPDKDDVHQNWIVGTLKKFKVKGKNSEFLGTIKLQESTDSST